MGMTVLAKEGFVLFGWRICFLVGFSVRPVICKTGTQVPLQPAF